MQPAVDYHEAYLWADRDRHRLIGLEWQATKRAIAAEKEIKRLHQQIRDMQMQPEFIFPSHQKNPND